MASHRGVDLGEQFLWQSNAVPSRQLLRLAGRAGHLLVDAAQRHAGAAWWPLGDGPDQRPFGYWCNGSAGVGAFLVRLWRVTGDPLARELADEAGAAVFRDRWRTGPVLCHGVAGGGELLLDLAAATDQRRYLDMAAELAQCIAARAVRRGRLLYLSGDRPDQMSVGYGTGLAGVLAFLHRLRHGGARRWMPDDGILPAFRPDPHPAALATG